jgi:predicted O-methyltransferase YrrM
MEAYTIDQVKAICEASRLPLGVPFLDARMEEYQAKYGGAYPYYAALRDLTRALRPAVVVEIGTWEGTSAACFAEGCAESTVITIDHHSDPGDDANRAKTMDACGEYENLLYVQGCSTEKVHALKPGTQWVFPTVKDFLAGRPIDFLFIDGWHGGEFARADFDTFAPLLSPDALVICDDIYGADCETLFGMVPFWNSLPGEKYLDPRIHSVYSMGFAKLGNQ